MTCPSPPQPPSVFTSLFPTSPSQWVELSLSGCFVVLLIFIALIRLARFLRPLPAGPQRWILLTLAGVGLLGFAGFVFCFLWNTWWRQVIDSWFVQELTRVEQGCSPSNTGWTSSGDWVFTLEWVFLIPGLLLFLLVRWRAGYLIRHREQRLIAQAEAKQERST